MDTDKLHPFEQSVEFYWNLWISGLIRNRNELENPNQNPEIEGIHLHHIDMSN